MAKFRDILNDVEDFVNDIYKEDIIVEQTMDIPAFLRKRQIPLELMQGEYGRKTPAESL